MGPQAKKVNGARATLQFGGDIGGPVLHNKLFFYFDFNDSRIVAGSVVQRVVPSAALRAGTITYDNNSGGTSTATLAQVNAFDPAGIGEDQAWLADINKRYPMPNHTTGGDGLNSLEYTFNAPDNDNAPPKTQMKKTIAGVPTPWVISLATRNTPLPMIVPTATALAPIKPSPRTSFG